MEKKIIKNTQWQKGIKFISIIFLFFIFQIENNQAQNFQKIDSIRKCIKQAKYDSVRLRHIVQLSQEYVHYQPDSCIDLLQLALMISEKIKDVKYRAECISNLARVCWVKGDFPNSLKYTQLALTICEEHKLNKLKAKNMNLLGLLYMEDNDLDLSLKQFNLAFAFEKQIKDTTYISRILGNIGDIYLLKKDSVTAYRYYKQALVISIARGDEMNSSTNYLALGNIFIGQNKFQEAFENLEKSRVLAIKVNDSQNEARTLALFTLLFFKEKKYEKCIRFGKQAVSLASQINDLHSLCNAAEVLHDCFLAQNKTKEALEYYKISITAKDSMYSLEKNKEMNRMQHNFEIKSKLREIQMLNKDKKLAQFQSLIFGVAFVLVFLLGIVVFRSRQKERKAKKILAEQKAEIETYNHELNQQNTEIMTQRDEIEKQRNQIILQKKDIVDSIEYASHIQQAILPQEKAFINLFSDYFILFKPKDIVSGDFYWATQINEWTIVTVADCTGHGVPGAFMSMLGISFLNEIILKNKVVNASEILNQLRIAVIDALKQKGDFIQLKDGMDIALCVINSNTLEMQYAGANNPCWIINSRQSIVDSPQSTGSLQQPTLPTGRQVANSQLLELKPDKMPISIHTKMQAFTNQNYQLCKGDILYLLSDGYADQFGGPNRKKFQSNTLKNILIENNQQSMTDQKEILYQSFELWKGNNEQIDDVTIVGIRI